MDTFYQTKLKELVTEFTRYLVENPDFAEAIPEGAQVVLLDQRDPTCSRQAMQYIAQARDKDDNPQQPVVYIEVTKCCLSVPAYRNCTFWSILPFILCSLID